jgi:glucose 1-dehydrogenase
MLSEKFSLSGKIALVTGSSQGIGEGIALAFAESGADVILHCRKDKSEAEEVASKVKAFGVRCFIVEGDFTKPDSITKMYDEVKSLTGKVDILILNASVQIPKIWTEITVEDIDDQINANFKSSLLLMQRFAPEMVSNGWGRIVTLGSVQQVKPHPSMAVYAATKSAMLNLVQNIAMQLADKGVTVNNLAPGVIGTPRLPGRSVHRKIVPPWLFCSARKPEGL